MTDLLIPPERFTGRVEDFGYRYLAFENRRMAAAERHRADTGNRELAIVLLGGTCSVNSSEGDFVSAGGRTPSISPSRRHSS
jgi:5-deoxy-glucuronate isomerase